MDATFYFDISVALSWMNVILSAVLVRYSIMRWKRFGATRFMLARLGLGVYWGLLYVYIALAGMSLLPAADPVIFGRIFVRPMFTLTLLIMTIASCRHRHNAEEKHGRPITDPSS